MSNNTDKDVAFIQALAEILRNSDLAEIEVEREKYANDLRTLEHERELLALARKEVERARRLVKTNVVTLILKKYASIYQ